MLAEPRARPCTPIGRVTGAERRGHHPHPGLDFDEDVAFDGPRRLGQLGDRTDLTREEPVGCELRLEGGEVGHRRHPAGEDLERLGFGRRLRHRRVVARRIDERRAPAHEVAAGVAEKRTSVPSPTASTG